MHWLLDAKHSKVANSVLTITHIFFSTYKSSLLPPLSMAAITSFDKFLTTML